jgi:hypothetical protein
MKRKEYSLRFLEKKSLDEWQQAHNFYSSFSVIYVIIEIPGNKK